MPWMRVETSNTIARPWSHIFCQTSLPIRLIIHIHVGRLDVNKRPKSGSFTLTRLFWNVSMFAVYPSEPLPTGLGSHLSRVEAAVNVNSVPPPWSGVDANSTSNPEEQNIFSVDFLANPLKLCDVNSSNTWVLIVFIFVIFLSSYLLSTYEALHKMYG
jgi:hypothetical protein